MAQKKVSVDLDFGGNRIINVTLDALASDPAIKAARFYYNTTDKVVKFSNGEKWLALATTESVKVVSDNVAALATRMGAAEGDITKLKADVSSITASIEELPSTIQNEIKGKLNVEFNASTKKISLKYNGTEFSSFDASSLVKDGMLSDVVIVTNPSGQPSGTYLKFTFNTDAGKSDVFVNVTSLIDVYTAGNGIAILGKSISVKMSPNSESYLAVDSTGVKLTGIDKKITDTVNAAKTAILGEAAATGKYKTVKALNDKVVSLDTEMGKRVKIVKFTATSGTTLSIKSGSLICVGVKAYDSSGEIEVAIAGLGSSSASISWNGAATSSAPITALGEFVTAF